MDLVRRAINDIRTNWGQYPQFMRELREFMEGDDVPLGRQSDQAERLRTLFASVKEWSDSAGRACDADYSAIRLYTSEYGYRRMFSAINMAFRNDELTEDPLALRCATFLVELLSIDLFNYRVAVPRADNFVGHVYRGMCVSVEDLEMFTRVTRGPIAERYVAIPLAMASASRDRASALAFALKEASRAPGRYPLLWDIRVASLDAELLAVYRARYPASVVTSLCAVPIDQLSDYPQEKEVLLRGPHFQILRVGKDETSTTSAPLHVIEAVMLNSNRDHISAIASNVGDDRRARDLFRRIVLIHRSTICAEHAASHGLSDDAEAYRSIVSENRMALSLAAR